MLDHKDGVAVIAQGLQRVDKPLVITLMQTDGRLIKDIQHIDKARPYLGSQPNALTLTARECVRESVQRQITQSHVEQEV